jgi:hypothetical protein
MREMPVSGSAGDLATLLDIDIEGTERESEVQEISFVISNSWRTDISKLQPYKRGEQRSDGLGHFATEINFLSWASLCMRLALLRRG